MMLLGTNLTAGAEVKGQLTIGSFVFELEQTSTANLYNVYLVKYGDRTMTPPKKITGTSSYSGGLFYVEPGTTGFKYKDNMGKDILFSDSPNDTVANWCRNQFPESFTYDVGQKSTLQVGDFKFDIESTGTIGYVYAYISAYKQQTFTPHKKVTYFSFGDGKGLFGAYRMNNGGSTFYYGNPLKIKPLMAFADNDVDELKKKLIADGMNPVDDFAPIEEEAKRRQQEQSSSSDITVSPQIKQLNIDQNRLNAERSGLQAFTKPVVYETSIFTKYGKYILLGLGGVLIWKAFAMIAQEDDKEYKELMRIRRMKMNVQQKRKDIADKRKEKIDLEKRMKEIDEITGEDEREVDVANGMLNRREEELLGDSELARNRDRLDALYGQGMPPSEIDKQFPLTKTGGFDAGEVNIGGGAGMLLGKGVDLAKDVVVKGVEKVGDVAQAAVPALGNVIQTGISTTGQVLGEGAKQIGTGINTAIAGVAPAIGKGLELVKDTGMKAIEGGVKLVGDVVGGTTKVATDIGTSISSGIREAEKAKNEQIRQEEAQKQELKVAELGEQAKKSEFERKKELVGISGEQAQELQKAKLEHEQEMTLPPERLKTVREMRVKPVVEAVREEAKKEIEKVESEKEVLKEETRNLEVVRQREREIKGILDAYRENHDFDAAEALLEMIRKEDPAASYVVSGYTDFDNIRSIFVKTAKFDDIEKTNTPFIQDEMSSIRYGEWTTPSRLASVVPKEQFADASMTVMDGNKMAISAKYAYNYIQQAKERIDKLLVRYGQVFDQNKFKESNL